MPAGVVRRDGSIWQLFASYAIGSWIVLQVAETLSSLIGLPLWFGRALLVVLVVGLGVLAITSVVQRRATLNGGAGAGMAAVMSWQNVWRGAAVTAVTMVLVTVLYLGARSAGLGPLGTLQARGVLEDQERLILADFEGNAEQAGLSETATTLLRIDLSQSPAISVLEPVQLDPVLERMRIAPGSSVTYEVALEAARREGIKAVVAGELLQAGTAVVVSARIVAASTGEVLVAVRETAKAATDLPDVVDRVSAQLRERVGESLRSIQGEAPLERVTTSSLQALDKYAQANRANDAGGSERAIALLDEAIAEDSTFAMAYRKLGIILLNNDLEPDRRTLAFTRSYELGDRLTDRERWLAEAAFLTYVEGDERGAMARYETLLESYPTDRIALNNLALAYRQLGRYREAAELYIHSVDQGGAPATTYSGAATMLYLLGDLEGAREVVTDFGQTHPDNPSAPLLSLALLSATFDYEQAEPVARALLERAPGTMSEVLGLLQLAQVRLVQGRVEEGQAGYRAMFELAAELGGLGGTAPAAAEAVIAAAVALNYSNRSDEAVRIVDEFYASSAADLSSDQREDSQFAGIYALAGRPERAQELVDRYEGVEDAPGLTGWSRARGLVALAEGRAEDAIDLLHRGRTENRGCLLCGLSELGRAFETAAQPDSAIYYYERYMTEPDIDRLTNSDNITFWYVVPRLAQLQAAAGATDRARELYTLFLETTAGADAAYAPRREQVATALQDLGGA